MNSPTRLLPIVYTVGKYNSKTGETKLIGEYVAVNASLQGRR